MPYNSRAEVDAYLMKWGYESLSQFREWRQLRDVEESAASVLAVYYMSGFGLDRETATTLGELIADRILRLHFVFARPMESNLDLWDAQSVPTEKRMAAQKSAGLHGSIEQEKRIPALLRRAVLEGRAADVQWLLQNGVSPNALDNIRTSLEAIHLLDTPPNAPGESPLFAALEHPGIVKLLIDAGADVNHRNAFGKSALMYAAQYDLLESARLLLAAKADPNLATTEIWDCYYTVQNWGHTALMYAAENASVESMKLLIDAGADRSAKDSRGNTAESYLRENALLDEQERWEAAQLLKVQAQ